MSERKQDSTSTGLAPGDHVGAYRIERCLGSGGMAEVFYGIHEGLERPAAIKVLRASLAADDVHLQRFMQEARAAASLVHSNIVQVYDVGRDGDHRYIAQEYIPGSNLREYLAIDSVAAESVNQGPPQSDVLDKPFTSPKDEASSTTETNSDSSTRPKDRQLPLTEVLSILLQILAALTKSANRGIVHRDIKPENIMLTPDGEAKVADFGLARLLLGDDPQLTRAGTTLGTPMYMSPEQIQEGQVGIRSDLYSLGATIFHMLAGSPPYTGETPLSLAMKHVQAPVPDIRVYRDDLPDSVVRLLSRLLAKSPDDRFDHPSDVLAFLKANQHGDLAEYWPDQTVPLPRAVAAVSSGPMEATLQLRAKLRKLRRSRQRVLFRGLGLAACFLAAFLVGAAATFERPFFLRETTTSQIYNGIEQQESVQQQYDLALLRNDLHPIYKWEAVGHYFKKEASSTNRMYTGMASLQLASALQFRGDYGDAERVLGGTISDIQMPKLYVALAHLQLADGACWENFEANNTQIKEHIDKAFEIYSSKLTKGDRDLLMSTAQLLHNEIRGWFRGDQAET